MRLRTKINTTEIQNIKKESMKLRKNNYKFANIFINQTKKRDKTLIRIREKRGNIALTLRKFYEI